MAIEPSDLLVVNRGGTDYKITAADLKEFVLSNPTPWKDSTGGIFHIKNVAGGDLSVWSGPHTAWDLDGKNEREITKVAPGEELVFVTSSNAGGIFTGNGATWEFGEYTDVSKVTKMNNMFERCSAFNADISGWDTSSVSGSDGMFGMFSDSTAFNQNLSGWCVSNIDSKPGFFDPRSGFEGQTDKQPQWGTCPRGEDQA